MEPKVYTVHIIAECVYTENETSTFIKVDRYYDEIAGNRSIAVAYATSHLNRWLSTHNLSLGFFRSVKVSKFNGFKDL